MVVGIVTQLVTRQPMADPLLARTVGYRRSPAAERSPHPTRSARAGPVVVSICGQSGRAESLAAASTILPARRTIKPLYAGSRRCPLVTILLTGRLARQRPITLRHKLTPTGQSARRDTSRLSGACSNACGPTAKNLVATRRAITAPATILATDPHPGTRGFLTRNLLIRSKIPAVQTSPQSSDGPACTGS